MAQQEAKLSGWDWLELTCLRRENPTSAYFVKADMTGGVPLPALRGLSQFQCGLTLAG